MRVSPHYRFRPRLPERELQHSFVCDMPESMYGAELLALVAAPDYSPVQPATGHVAEGAPEVGASDSDAGDGSVGAGMGNVDKHIDRQGDGQGYVNGETPILPPPRTRFFPLVGRDKGSQSGPFAQR